MAGAVQVREVLRSPFFLRLYSTRLVSAAADGIFQAALASYVFFSPEKATTPAKAAAALAALLLPYSIAGPFVGVFLDRWHRQRVLVVANTVKVALVLVVAGLVLAASNGSAFFTTTVVALGVNRFFLSALSASLPHLVDEPNLITANALSTTSGSVATITGAGIGGVIRLGLGSSAPAIASIVGLAALAYGTSAAVAATMGRDLLGPDADGLASSSARSILPALVGVGRDLLHATGQIRSRPRATHALAAISGHRFLFGVGSLMIVLLDRNYFATQGNVNGGILGLGATIAAVGAGMVLAALITPVATRRFGTTRWITALLGLAAVAIACFGLPFQQGLLVVVALLLGVSSHGVKICVDTTLQEQIADQYRGRVFSVYDMAFNVTYVGAAAVAATVLPQSGRSTAVMAFLAGGYALLAAMFAWASARTRDRRMEARIAARSGVPDAVATQKTSSEGSLRP